VRRNTPALFLLCSLTLPLCSGCLTLTALFNTKHLFPYETRSRIAISAAVTDLVVTLPAVGVAGYNYFSRERDWRERREDFSAVYGAVGLELFALADLGLAWALYKILWGEDLFHRIPFPGSAPPNYGPG
jgi:hypothetical protein